MKISLTILLAAILFSCSPAKRTYKQVTDINTLQRQFDQQKEEVLAKGIADYVKDNPCVFPELNLDSLCNGFITTESEPINRITDYGFTSTDAYSNDPYTQKGINLKTKRVLVPVPDNRMVKLLNDSLQLTRNKLLQCESKQFGKKEAVDEITKMNSEPNPWHFNYWALISITLLAAGTVFLILKFKK